MAYARNVWHNDDPATPLSAERLDRIEQGIESAHVTADAVTVASESLKTRVTSLEKLKDQPAQVDPQAIKTAVADARPNPQLILGRSQSDSPHWKPNPPALCGSRYSSPACSGDSWTAQG